MNPLLDQMAVVAIITGALAYFAVRFFKKRGGGKACGSDCGCGTAKAGTLGGEESKKPSS